MWTPGSQDINGSWRSGRDTSRDSHVDVHTTHRMLFERAEQSLKDGFASMQSALVDLQLQLQIKLRSLQDQQAQILMAQSPSVDAVAEFEENVKKIDRSLESFTAHASNLNHIKLTLARSAAFVSPDGNLAQLVTTDTLPYPTIDDRESMSRDYAIQCSAAEEKRAPPVIPLGSYGPHNEPHGSHNRLPNSTCFVFYLPQSTTNETLRQLFMRYGTVLNVYIAKDRITNKLRGFGFVDFATPREAHAAVAGLDKYFIDGKYLSVSIKV